MASDELRVESVPALMYHDVVPAGAEDSSGFLGRDAALYKIAPDMFDAHLAAMFTSEPVLASRDAYGLTMHGRFIIQRWTTPETAAALAAGEWLACSRQRLLWNVKKVGKHLGGRRYLRLRQLVLGHGNEVRWGDQP